MVEEQQDPYVIYQLRKPHQRGTAIVPRLVPKSHAPAFSHANYRFSRVRSRLPGAHTRNGNNRGDNGDNDADDASLYLPKSLEYPTNWGSFGSESSIWSQSSGPSAFPNRVTPLLKSLTRLPSTKPPSLPLPVQLNMDTGININTADDGNISLSESSSRVIDMDIERPSLLSSDGRDEDRSLKNFVTFDAPQLQANLPAPEALRPRTSGEYSFVLPLALAQVEKEDRIVQAAIDDPGSVRSDILEESINTNLLPLRQTHSPPPAVSSRATKRMEAAAAYAAEERRRKSDATQTKRRRGLFAWLFGGGERTQAPVDIDVNNMQMHPEDITSGQRKYADAHVAPIMDEEEEAFRRAQFVRGANGGRTRSGPRLSWGRRSMERKHRQSTERNTGQRESKGIGGSAKNIWNKLKRSASFTFGQKRARNNGDNNNGHGYNERREPPMVAGLQDDPIVPSSSFIQRKMASLRENTAKRMANAGKKDQRDVFNIPLERREDRPRKSNNILLANNENENNHNQNKAPRPTLDQLISARPDLHYATSQAVEKLANRINSDLSQGTTLRSMSFGSKVLNGTLEHNMLQEEGGGSNPKLQESLISSSEGGNSIGIHHLQDNDNDNDNSFDSFAPVLCEEESATDIISDRLRAFTKSSNIGNHFTPVSPSHTKKRKNGRGASGCLSPASPLSPGSGHSGSRELRLSNTSRMSIELLRARAAQMPLRPTEMDIDFSPPPTNNMQYSQMGQIPIGAVAEAKRRRKKMVGEYDYEKEYRNRDRNRDNKKRRSLVEEFQMEVGNTIRDDERRMERQRQQKKRSGYNGIGQQGSGGNTGDTRDSGIRERSRRSIHHDNGNTRSYQNETAKSAPVNRIPSVTDRVNTLNGAIATQNNREERISQIPHIRRNMANADVDIDDIDIRKMKLGNERGNDNTKDDVYPSDLEAFCECGCSCVYEADCKHCHDAKSCCSSVGRSGRSERSGTSGRSGKLSSEVSGSVSNGGKRFYSPSAQSPSLSVINGNRASLGKTAPSNEAWMETMMNRVEKIDAGKYAAREHGSGSFGNIGSTDWAARYGKTNNETPGSETPVVVKSGRPVSTPATSPASSDKRVSSIDLDNDVLSGRIFAHTHMGGTPQAHAPSPVRSLSGKLLGRFRK